MVLIRVSLSLQRDDVVALGFLGFGLSEGRCMRGIPRVLFQILSALVIPNEDLSTFFGYLIEEFLGVTPDLRARARGHVALHGFPVLAEQVEGYQGIKG